MTGEPDMLAIIETRVRQMLRSLGELSETDLSGLHGHVSKTETTITTTLDLRAQADVIGLANRASALINNMARLKDHLKEWCKSNAKNPERVEDLINNNHAVGVLYDLWNVEKHFKLDRKPRSGVTPRLLIHGQEIVIGGGGASSSSIILDTHLGGFNVVPTGDVRMRLVADVVDESGNIVGDFEKLCLEAANAWQAELAAVGINVV